MDSQNDQRGYGSASNKPATVRNEEYLHQLQNANRLKRLSHLKTREEEELENKEKGFSTHFSGANERAKPTRKPKVFQTFDTNKPVNVRTYGKEFPADFLTNRTLKKQDIRREDGSYVRNVSPIVLPQENSFSRHRPHDRTQTSEENADNYYDDDFEVEESECDSMAHVNSGLPDFSKTISTQDDSLEDSLEEKAKPQSKEAGDLTDQLLQKIQNLTSNKQEKLLSLISMLEKSVDINTSTEQKSSELTVSETSIFSPSKRKYKKESPKNEDPVEVKSNKQLNETHGTLKISPIKGIESSMKSEEQTETDQFANPSHFSDELTSSSFGDTTVPLTLRLRIHNTWNGQKFASIRSMRLVRVNSKDEVDMSDFTFRLSVGNNIIPKNVESYKHFSSIISRKKSAITSRIDWKIQIEPTIPTEIILTGFISRSLPLSELELLIWNGEVINNCGPVKDTDVYVNDTFVWTGELTETASDTFVNSAALTTRLGDNKIGAIVPCSADDPRKLILTVRGSGVNANYGGVSPSNSIRLVKIPKPSTPRIIDKADSNKVEFRDELNTTRVLKPKTPTEMIYKEKTKEVDVEPTWYAEIKTPRSMQTDEVRTNQAEATTASIPCSNDPNNTPSWLNELKTPRNEKDLFDLDKTGSLKKDSTKKGRKKVNFNETETVDNNIQAYESEKLIFANSRSLTSNKESEEVLRQSLDAIKKSDRKNRGKIGDVVAEDVSKVGLYGHSIEKEILKDQVEEVNQNDNDTVANQQIPVIIPDMINTFSHRIIEADELQTKLKSRANKIGAVQETVNKAVANLADIMSNLYSQNSAIIKSKEEILYGTQTIGLADKDILNESMLESSICNIPILPKGRVLNFEILSTWGDSYYVGLNGIDIFDKTGNILSLDGMIKQISAEPMDINVLPEYGDDPRKITNLLDGTNFTRDDLHVWLAPHGGSLTPPLANNLVALISVEFAREVEISMIRIWNYNKSRTYCYRGIRKLRLKLDDKIIFEGEVKPAPGLVTSPAECSEIILFTTDMFILGQIRSFDMNKGYLTVSEDPTNEWIESFRSKKSVDRPSTADKDKETLQRAKKANVNLPQAEIKFESRPKTSVSKPINNIIDDILKELPDLNLSTSLDLVPKSSPSREKSKLNTSLDNSLANSELLDDGDIYECRVVKLKIISTWGDKNYAGLNGLDVLIGRGCNIADIDPSNIRILPTEISDFYDSSNKKNLVNNVNNTTNDRNAWIVPLISDNKVEIVIDLGRKCTFSGLHLWNYNKPGEAIQRGVRIIALECDGCFVGYIETRIGPGCDGVDFKQKILLSDVKNTQKLLGPSNSLRYISPSVKQFYETLSNPSGMLFKIILFSNWGDGYYIGLDGIEILDQNGIIINNKCSLVTAVPNSLRDIGITDHRIPSNLLSEPYCSTTGDNSWISPLVQSMTTSERNNAGLRLENGNNANREFTFHDENSIYILFDHPVSIGSFRFYNYTKTPKRGVRDFGIDLDGNIIFLGTLKSMENMDINNPAQAVVFSNDIKITKKEQDKIHMRGEFEQDVLCINERQVMVKSKAMYEQPSAAAVGVVYDISNRPTTALVK